MTVVCVLGMHRSGTSATAKLLSALGVYLGPEQHLLGPAADNPEGFYEHVQILQIDDALLQAFGGSWQAPPAFPVGWERQPRLDQVKAAARQVIETDFGGRDLWGWKEPRACLTLPFWREVLADVKYVICLRNPVEVAASLETRNRMPFAQAVDLWFEYNASALLYTSGQSRLVFSYDHYSSDPDAELHRLGKFLGVRVPRRGSPAHAEIVATFRQDLRHHRASTDLVDQDQRLTDGEKAFARWLDEAAVNAADGIEAATVMEHYRRVSLERSAMVAKARDEAERAVVELRQASERAQGDRSGAPDAGDFDRLVSGIGQVLEETLTGYSVTLRESLEAQQHWLERNLGADPITDGALPARPAGNGHTVRGAN